RTVPGAAGTASAQAFLLSHAFQPLGIDRPIIVGHSSETLAALALALDHPHKVSGLVLVFGYYYPAPRGEIALFSAPAMPLLGDILNPSRLSLAKPLPRSSSTECSPLKGYRRALPQSGPRALPVANQHLLARPRSHDCCCQGSQRALPVFVPPAAILAGEADEVVSYRQAQRLHADVAGSVLDILPGGSHMATTSPWSACCMPSTASRQSFVPSEFRPWPRQSK